MRFLQIVKFIVFMCLTRENQIHCFASEKIKTFAKVCNQESAEMNIFDLWLCYNQKTWGLVISIEQIAFSQYVSVFAWIFYICVLACTDFYAIWKTQTPIKVIPCCAPAVFPLKSKVLTAAAVDDEFFLTPDSHRCWLFWNMLLKFPFLSGCTENGLSADGWQ